MVDADAADDDDDADADDDDADDDDADDDADDDDDDVLSVRNKDLTWPEELCQLAKNKALIDKSQTGYTLSSYSQCPHSVAALCIKCAKTDLFKSEGYYLNLKENSKNIA